MLEELATQAHAKAETSWRQRKGPMAAYWRAVGVYARHTARATRKGTQAPQAADQAAQGCDRAPSGSLYPAERVWGTGGAQRPHCRSCGAQLTYSKAGLLEHREVAA